MLWFYAWAISIQYFWNHSRYTLFRDNFRTRLHNADVKTGLVVCLGELEQQNLFITVGLFLGLCGPPTTNVHTLLFQQDRQLSLAETISLVLCCHISIFFGFNQNCGPDQLIWTFITMNVNILLIVFGLKSKPHINFHNKTNLSFSKMHM